jgi:hypothetical protein
MEVNHNFCHKESLTYIKSMKTFLYVKKKKDLIKIYIKKKILFILIYIYILIQLKSFLYIKNNHFNNENNENSSFNSPIVKKLKIKF